MKLRHLILLSGLIFASILLSTSVRAVSIDAKHYDITIRHSVQDTVYKVRCKADYFKPDSAYYVDNYFTMHANVNKITASSTSGTFDVPYRHEGRKLNMTVPDELFDDNDISIQVEYTMPAPPVYDKFLLEQRYRWFPHTNDDPATFNLTAYNRAGFIVLSNGDLTSSGFEGGINYSKWKSDVPVKQISYMLAQENLYEVSSKKSEKTGVEIFLYSESIDEASRMKILEQSISALEYFAEKLGPYNYQRLSIIERTDVPGATVGSGMIFIGPNMVDMFLQNDFRELGALTSFLWIGHGMFPPFKGKGAWFLGLSLPQHLKLMYIREFMGDSTFNSTLNGMLDNYRTTEGLFDEEALMDIDMPRTGIKTKIIFSKGPYVYELLKNKLGEDRYYELLSNLYSEFNGKKVGIKDFLDKLKTIDESGEVVTYFNDLITQKGMPE